MNGLYTLPPDIKKDIEEYKAGVEKFLRGDTHPTRFRAHRVPMGVYEQRTNNTFMTRIRLSGGGITPEQMERVAQLARQYGSETLHVTTRMDIQIHNVDLKDTPAIMEGLLEVGLTTKGGGGNTVRNITACCDSGVCDKEVFDVFPYAIAVTEHMIKDPRSYTLPRKFKIAFSGCGDDCSLATVNDVGFIATEKEVNGEKIKGFRVYVAGGMGSGSRVADTLEEFVPADEVADICDAIKNLFDKNGNRRNKHKARLRFLMEALGREEFLSLYGKELDAIKQGGGTRLAIRDAGIAAPAGQAGETTENGIGDSDPGYAAWVALNVLSQKQNGYKMVKIRLPLGDITGNALSALANIAKKHGEGIVRADTHQNLLLRWVHQTELADVYRSIKKIGIAHTSGPARDITCCAGSSTCRLGICLSRGLAQGISKELSERKEQFDHINDMSIKISGCPNSCGHHPIGKIGLFGASRTVGERLAPYYAIQLGGRVEEGETVLGKVVGLAHARYVPEIISKFLESFRQEGGGDYYRYLDRDGRNRMKAIMEEHSTFPSFEEDRSFYYDWGADQPFSLAGRGPGECGAGVFDMIDVDLKEARAAVEKASPAALYQAVTRASRALLVTRGVEADSDLMAFELFEKEFINSGLVEQKFTKLMFLASEYKKGNLRDKALIESHELITGLVSAVKELYDSMDDSLQFNKTGGETKPAETTEEAKGAKTPAAAPPSGRKLMDLKGVQCPYNYVKAKIEIEMMDVGEELELLLDDGEPIKNVPNSLKNDGQEILTMEQMESGHYRLVVKKKV